MKRILPFLLGVVVFISAVFWLRHRREARPAAPISSATGAPAPLSSQPGAASGPLRFVDVTQAAGIDFTHNSGAYGKKYLPETLGSGVAFIDYNHSGYQSVLLLDGQDWPGHPTRLHGQTMRLYRNNGNGTFTDVTRQAGLAAPMYGMGAAVGDYLNNGNQDLFVTGLDGNHLFRNNGNGTFTDVTRQAGLDIDPGLATSAAWVDYDRDGCLDLWVDYYVRWSRKTDIYCTEDGVHKSYCTPEKYHGASPRLFHQIRSHGQCTGRFVDVTHAAGVYDPTSKSLGVSIFYDGYNGDGRPDIFVSNDTQPNKLFRNNGNGTFSEEAVSAGVAFSEDGVARGGMGTDVSDYNRSGRFSLVVGNFSNQMLGLYRNEGHGLFLDVAPSSDVGRASLLSLSFGTFFFDYNLDGRPDLFVANGHLDPAIREVQPRVHYAEKPLLFQNIGHGKFRNATADVGPQLGRRVVARGAAYGDYDLTGFPDILVSTNNGPAYLYYNTGNGNHALRIRTVGVKSNRDGIGALIQLHTASGWQEQYVKSGSSYLSASELPVTFGLGSAAGADTIRLHWPSGEVQTLHNVAGGQFITVTEGVGITARQPLRKCNNQGMDCKP